MEGLSTGSGTSAPTSASSSSTSAVPKARELRASPKVTTPPPPRWHRHRLLPPWLPSSKMEVIERRSVPRPNAGTLGNLQRAARVDGSVPTCTLGRVWSRRKDVWSVEAKDTWPRSVLQGSRSVRRELPTQAHPPRPVLHRRLRQRDRFEWMKARMRSMSRMSRFRNLQRQLPQRS